MIFSTNTQVLGMKLSGVLVISCSIRMPPTIRIPPKEIYSHILGVVLANQYNLKKRKELFGKRADEAVMNELSEIDCLNSYEPQRIKNLTYEDKKRALELIILVSEKRADQDAHEKTKSRYIAVGSKQAPMTDMRNPMGHY